MAKDPKSGTPKAGSMTPLQPWIRSDGSAVDDRMAPCGSNNLNTRDDDGDEAGEY